MADTSKLIRYFEASGSGEEARRMLDLAEQVVKGRPYRVADFTSPAGLVIADAIKANYPQIIVKTDGGYEGAERIRKELKECAIDIAKIDKKMLKLRKEIEKI